MRKLDNDDISSFLNAAADRPSDQKTLEQVRAILKRDHPIRMIRIETHLMWLKRQMRKYGLQPEDARWLL